MEDPIMKALREDTSEVAEAERRLAGSFVADPELRDRLEARDKFRRTHLQLLHDAEEKGFREGLAEVRAERIEKGKAQGRIESSREMARKLKARDMSIAEIAEIIGLPEDEIREL
ncbi:MAG: hypothetical protein WD492_01350 [Alkalispirochaeta sp.]